MQGPRSPYQEELSDVLSFLKTQLRPEENWSVEQEYPTALNPHNIHNMRIITEGDQIVSHAVIKPLVVKTPALVYKIAAIGSVVTHPDKRNLGLSSQIIEDCLDKAREQSCDLAVLWTSLHDFYRKFNFELSGFEPSYHLKKGSKITAKANPAADATPKTGSRLRFEKSPNISAEALMRLYSQHTVNTARTLDDFKKYLTIPNMNIYTVWDEQHQLKAYAIEGKGADLTNYIHEWGGGTTALIYLLNSVTEMKDVTFMVPIHSKNMIQILNDSEAVAHHGYLGMFRIVNHQQLFIKVKKYARSSFGYTDFILEKKGDEFLFGFKEDAIIISDEKELMPLLFGPFPEIPILKKETITKLQKILPLPLWLWGWDSI